MGMGKKYTFFPPREKTMISADWRNIKSSSKNVKVGMMRPDSGLMVGKEEEAEVKGVVMVFCGGGQY